jgi:hypothetical protein
MIYPALPQDRVGGMPRFYPGVNRHLAIGDRAMPDVMIALASPLE